MKATAPVRMIYGEGAYLSGLDVVRTAQDKIFAVIGPFDAHQDKIGLQRALEAVLRTYNDSPTAPLWHKEPQSPKV